MKQDNLGDIELHALVDGELDAARAKAVRTHLAARSDDAARVESWRRQNAAIRRAFEETTREPVLSALAPRVGDDAIHLGAKDTPRLDAIRAVRRRRRAVATLAAFLGGACVALLGAIAFSRVSLAPDSTLLGEPAAVSPSAHARRARLAWRTYARESDRALDRPLADRSGVAIALQRATALPRIPDFSYEKFDLVAVRTMPGESEPAAFLLYETAPRVKVALIVERTPDADAGPQLNDDGGLRCLTWRAGGYSYALVGPAEADTLRLLARATVVAFSGR